jgi:ankyrin repeat protein
MFHSKPEIEMTRLRKLSLILALLTCLPAAVRANAQSNDLIDAADRGDLPRVRALLAGGAKVNARMTGGGGFTALYVAAAWGHLEVARALLAKGRRSTPGNPTAPRR